MFLTIHGATAILIATKTASPFLGFILSFLSHYLIDGLPHDEPELNRNDGRKKMMIRTIKIVGLDMIVLFFYLLFVSTKIELNIGQALICILASIIPDLMWGFEVMLNKPFMRWNDKLHTLFHWHKQIIKNHLLGYFFQVVTLIIITVAIFYFS